MNLQLGEEKGKSIYFPFIFIWRKENGVYICTRSRSGSSVG